MNSTGDNEERTDYDHEGQVIDSRVNDPRGLFNDEEIIQTNYAGESDAKLVVVTLPMMLSDERNERDRHQQGHKRHNDPPTRACCDETQDPIHVAIGLIAVRSVNETRLCGGCLEAVRKRRLRVDLLHDADGIACRCATASISAVCGNMSKAVTELIVNFSCSSFKSRASVAGLQDT